MKNHLQGHKYRKQFMSAITAFCFRCMGTNQINEQFESNRYPKFWICDYINSCVSHSEQTVVCKNYK